MNFYTQKELVLNLRKSCNEMIDLRAKNKIIEISNDLIDSRGIDLKIKNSLKDLISEYYDYIDDCKFVHSYQYKTENPITKKEAEKLWTWFYDSFFNETFLSTDKEKSKLLVSELKSTLRKANIIAIVTPNNKFNQQAYDELLKTKIDSINSLLENSHTLNKQDNEFAIQMQQAIIDTKKEFKEILESYS